MSDFDKEAEREKLREKFEKEDEKREATEQMSELLLKGATMTNAHCNECGDPIFRYDGQEFCPTCQKPVARNQQENGAGGDAGAGDGDAEAGDGDAAEGGTASDGQADGDHIEVADPSDEAHVQFGSESDADAETADGHPGSDTAESETDGTDTTPDEKGGKDPETVPREAGETGSTHATAGATPTDGDQRSADSPQSPGLSDENSESTAPQPNPPVSGRTSQSGDTGVTDVDAELDAATTLLAQTVHRFAERAAAAENPREAQEHLEAAREAAEALDATRF